MNLDRDLVRAALPSYDIDGEIGRGGWGMVLAARHRTLGRRVAVKQLPRAYAFDPVVRERFVTEAKTISSLDHPHVVPIYDFVDEGNAHLIVMELMEGGTLRERSRDQPVRPDVACAVTIAIASALHAVHRLGILHRDLKPENVLFNANRVPKLGDFGVAKELGTDRNLTVAGEVLGTPAYMSPEQVTGSPLGPGSDVYSLAVMLFEMLAGQLPFAEENPMALLTLHASAAPREVSDLASIPDELAAVVMAGLSKRPADRPADAEEFGVRVASAALGGFGPNWLAESAIPYLGGGRIGAAALEARPNKGSIAADPAPIEPSSRSVTVDTTQLQPQPAERVLAAPAGSNAVSPATTIAPRLHTAERAAMTMDLGTEAGGRARRLAGPNASRSRRSLLLGLGALAVAVMALLVTGLNLGVGRKSAEVGRINGKPVLADGRGRTLYVSARDEPGKSMCNDPCTIAWPPVEPGSVVAGVNVARITQITRLDGRSQLALDGRPLYRFANDRNAGDTTGHNVSGVWFALTTSGQPLSSLVRIGSTGAGSVLVDGAGFVVYTFDRDPAGSSACNDPCSTTWVPVPGSAEVDPLLDASRFTPIERDDGSLQLALDGMPLYRYVGDTNPGEANGTTVTGGIWKVVPAERVSG